LFENILQRRVYDGIAVGSDGQLLHDLKKLHQLSLAELGLLLRWRLVDFVQLVDMVVDIFGEILELLLLVDGELDPPRDRDFVSAYTGSI
jgi:hypothetical protein